jgi:hypothetical protein
MKDRFLRLLAACERLARDEAAALAHRNFEALSNTQQVKSALLADLAASAGDAARDSEIAARLAALLKSNCESSQLVSNIAAATGERLRQVRAAANQLRAMRTVYTTGQGQPHQAFSAHG